MKKDVLKKILILTFLILLPVQYTSYAKPNFKASGVSVDYAYDLSGGHPVKQKKYYLPSDKQVTWWCQFSPFAVWGQPKLLAKWYDPSGRLYNEVNFSTPWGNNLYAKTSIPISGSYPAEALGQWKVEVFWDGEKVDQQSFFVGQPKPGPKTQLAKDLLSVEYLFGSPDIPEDKEESEAMKKKDKLNKTKIKSRMIELKKKNELTETEINTRYWGGITAGMFMFPREYAERLYKKLDNTDGDYRIYAKIAQTHLYSSKDKEEAEKAMRRAIFLRDDSAYLYNLLGVILASPGRYDEAIDAFRTAISIDKEYYPAYNNIGSVLYKKGDYVNARKYFSIAAKNDANANGAKKKVAICDAIIKKQVEKIKNLQEGIIKKQAEVAKEKKEKFAKYDKLIEDRKYEKCIKLLRKDINKGVYEADSRFYLAKIYHDLELYPQAIDEYKIMLKEDTPQRSDIEIHLAAAYYENGNYKDSMDTLKSAVLKDPSNDRIFMYMAKCFSETNDSEKAIKVAKESVLINEDNVDSWQLLGKAYFNAKENDKSIEAYSKALKFKPTDSRIYLDMASSYMAEGKDDEALKMIEKAVILNPEDEDVLEEAKKLRSFLTADETGEGNA